MAIPTTGTFLDALVASLRQAGHYNRDSMVGPAAVLWPDESRQWESIIPLLRNANPMLLTVGGDYIPAQRQGPAIWVRALLARQLEAETWPSDAVPIIYLPGIGRGTLRAAESCPASMRPLAELQYRGVFWSQPNVARDWTVYAFLKSPSGLGLDVARDEATLAAIQRSLVMLADTAVSGLRDRKLEADDFDMLLAPDLERDMLRWMNDPKGSITLWSKEYWEAFRSQSKSKLGFDPKSEGELVAVERMASRRGEWKKVWSRFAESPRNYSGVAGLLGKALPTELVFDPAYWPGENDKKEAALRSALLGLPALGGHEAVQRVVLLEAEHGPRRTWVWAQLDRAPLAFALEHLVVMSAICSKPLGGANADSMAKSYEDAGWRADDAVLQALTKVDRGPDVDAVKGAIRAVYQPWLEQSAKHLQELTRKHGYTGHQPANQSTLTPMAGECVLFVDGLRFDLGRRLEQRLTKSGLRVALSVRWSALPSVTPTGKTAVSPVADLLGGGGKDFNPVITSGGEELTTDRFRKLLATLGVDYVGGDTIGNPEARGWTEYGDVDSAGHDQQWKLARRVDELLREVVERIEALIGAGWKKIKVVTDHGWLLLPGGLPKVELPTYLADSKWGRCAALKTTAGDGDQLVVDWRWASSVRIALASGISCFRAGFEYAHGGLSLQECVTPILEVTMGAAMQPVKIEEVDWTRLRCRVRVAGAPPGARVEVRMKPADSTPSNIKGGKDLDHEGRASFVIEDDSLMGAAAVVVLLLEASTAPIAKFQTYIGGED